MAQRERVGDDDRRDLESSFIARIEREVADELAQWRKTWAEHTNQPLPVAFAEGERKREREENGFTSPHRSELAAWDSLSAFLSKSLIEATQKGYLIKAIKILKDRLNDEAGKETRVREALWIKVLENVLIAQVEQDKPAS